MSAISTFKNIMASGWPGVVAWETEKKEESLHLEFKVKDRENPNMTDRDWGQLAQAMSGFANSEGGVLVFGPHATDRGKNLPDHVQSIIPVSNVLSVRAAVQRRLHDLTDPPIAGVIVEAIENSDASSSGVIVVYIPRSDALPHRATEGKTGVRNLYWMRSALSTISMSHAVLAEKFGRRPMAKLYLAVQYSLSRYYCTADVWIGNAGRGYAERPAVSFIQNPDPENPDNSPDFWWHLLEPAKGWDTVVRPAGGKEGVGAIVRAGAETVLYPGMEMPLGFFKGAEPRPNGRMSFRLSVHGILYALNAAPARFGLVRKLAIDKDEPVQSVERVEVPVMDFDENP